MQDTGCRIQDAGCRIQDTGCRMQDAGRFPAPLKALAGRIRGESFSVVTFNVVTFSVEGVRRREKGVGRKAEG